MERMWIHLPFNLVLCVDFICQNGLLNGSKERKQQRIKEVNAFVTIIIILLLGVWVCTLVSVLCCARLAYICRSDNNNRIKIIQYPSMTASMLLCLYSVCCGCNSWITNSLDLFFFSCITSISRNHTVNYRISIENSFTSFQFSLVCVFFFSCLIHLICLFFCCF